MAYRATTAQWHADRSARRPKLTKLALNIALRTYVEERLAGVVVASSGASVPGPAVAWKGRRPGPHKDRRWAKVWSPEQIARRLPIDFPDDETMRKAAGAPRTRPFPAPSFFSGRKNFAELGRSVSRECGVVSRRHRPRRRPIQYPEASMMETICRGVPDTPPEPVIGLAEGETRWRNMTIFLGAANTYPNNTASASVTASAPSITVFSSEVACTVMFSAKNRANVT
jgi:hypothetical protein